MKSEEDALLGSGLSETSKDFLRRFVLDGQLPVSPPESGSGQENAGDLSLVKLGKARLGFASVRRKAVAQIMRLKATIRKAYRGMPEISDQVENGLAKLDSLIQNLDRQLEHDLDAALNADGDDRTRLLGKAGKTTGAFKTFLETDPVAKTIDDNPFSPGLNINRDLRNALADIQAALGK